MRTPKDILLPYQLEWVNDPSRFKIGCWSRQTGKSFSTAEETVEDILKTELGGNKTTWVTLSAGERQALEWMQKAKEWSKAYELTIANEFEERDSPEALIKSSEIHWPNGSRVIAIPANPNTARGYSANLNLDEFAFHENPDKIWRAIYPSISNPLRGHYKIRIVSTPNGKANKFYDLWTKNTFVKGRANNPQKWQYSGHLIDIYTAAKRGLPLDVEELKAGLDDPEGWRQEFECLFLDEASILLPYDLIATCESDDAVDTWDWDALRSSNPCYLGVDIGRKKDLTVFWLLEKIGDVLWTKAVKTFDKTPYREQADFLDKVLQRSCVEKACIDATGKGEMLAEGAATDFGAYRVEQCIFTVNLKKEIFEPLRRNFEDRTVRIPVSRAIREDLHALQRIASSAGQVKYQAPHTDDGHSDRATALALALRAATTDSVDYSATCIF